MFSLVPNLKGVAENGARWYRPSAAAAFQERFGFNFGPWLELGYPIGALRLPANNSETDPNVVYLLRAPGLYREPDAVRELALGLHCQDFNRALRVRWLGCNCPCECYDRHRQEEHQFLIHVTSLSQIPPAAEADKPEGDC